MLKKLSYVIALFLFFLGYQVSADQYVIVTASNAADKNELLVYDAQGQLLQSVATNGKGGVAPHIVGGGIAKTNSLVAVINYNSRTVSLFKHEQGIFKLQGVIPTISKPVSLAFGQNHLYILGTTTIESHLMNGDRIIKRPDGSSKLLVGDGSAAQVGYLPDQLIISERSNMIEIVNLRGGTVTNQIDPVHLPPPPKNDTPVGLVTRGDNAYVTIAHSDLVGVVKNGQLVNVVSSESQHAPCWLALLGRWLFSSNTPSKSITRYNASDTNLSIAELVAAKTNGEPTDIDADAGIVAVLEAANGSSALTQFQVDNNGNLTLINSVPTSDTANGIAIIKLAQGPRQ
jgi:hypothetical protein